MTTKRKVYAQYFSPGTLFPEIQTIELESGSLQEAAVRAKGVIECHGATPYSFDIVTKIVAEPIDDGEGGKLEVSSKEVERSGRYFLGGKIFRYEQVLEEKGENSILARNMRNQKAPICIVIDNGYRSTQLFQEQDCIVDKDTGDILLRGDSPEFIEYRSAKIKEWEDEWKNLRNTNG